MIFDTKRHEMIRWSKAVFDHILKQLLIKLFISNVPFIVALSYAKTAAFLNKNQPFQTPRNPHKIWEILILMSKKTLCTQDVSAGKKIAKGSLHSHIKISKQDRSAFGFPRNCPYYSKAKNLFPSVQIFHLLPIKTIL